MYKIVLILQHYYRTPAATCFEPRWSIVKGQTVAQNNRLTFSFPVCSRKFENSYTSRNFLQLFYMQKKR